MALWIAASLLGALIAAALEGPLQQSLIRYVFDNAMSLTERNSGIAAVQIGLALLAAAAAGLLQGLVVSRRLTGTLLPWLVATLLAAGIALLAVRGTIADPIRFLITPRRLAGISRVESALAYGAARSIEAGIVYGALQATVLFRRLGRHALWWIPAVVVGSALGTLAGSWLDFTSMARGADFQLFTGDLVAAAISSAVSGVALVALLRAAN